MTYFHVSNFIKRSHSYEMLILIFVRLPWIDNAKSKVGPGLVLHISCDHEDGSLCSALLSWLWLLGISCMVVNSWKSCCFLGCRVSLLWATFLLLSPFSQVQHSEWRSCRKHSLHQTQLCWAVCYCGKVEGASLLRWTKLREPHVVQRRHWIPVGCYPRKRTKYSPLQVSERLFGFTYNPNFSR